MSGSLSSTVNRMAERYGSRCTHRRITYQPVTDQPWKTAQGAATVLQEDIPCSLRRYRPQEIGGLVEEGDQLLTVPAQSIANQPEKGDEFQVGDSDQSWLTVKYLFTRSIGSRPVVHKITVTG